MSIQFALCLATLLFLAGIGTPIGHSTILAGIVYLAVGGQDLALAGEQALWGLYDSFVLLAVPLFIAAANIMNAGTISDRLLAWCVACVGRFRGGLGHVNVVASLIFSGMSGSAIADAAGIGKIIINMMTKGGRYPRGYAAAITAASATIGPIIPPSIPMVMYALISDQSIGYLFLGGILPGIFIGIVLMALNAFIASRRDFPKDEPIPLTKLPKMTLNAFPALMMPVILLYGIYGGVTTPTEGAAVAAAYALLLAGLFYRALTVSSLYRIFVNSARASAAVGLVIAGALILNYVVASENIPNRLAGVLVELEVHPLVFMIGVNLLLLGLGALLEATTIILVILPLFIPACSQLGIDLVHFGVIAVINTMIGLITPPFGMLLFVINAVTGISLGEIIRETWPFIAVLIGALLVLILVPDIVLWLPRTFGYAG
ncbi:MAG: TRAP transporter large permease [Desulfofustis sp.]|nr:TRAP transporter large permease [Desulfofustis sp.]NNF47296.1 TRAP transporter large permease [Desulfofustis sp.]NNK14112.1 TRAP transporter large permease [Desulfofustis sp.]NNK57861.1 TRAP transporter large permease [Desulfofustis sp.]